MDDLISRRKAFEYFVTLWECIGTIMDRDEWEDVCMTTANEIPSAQPEKTEYIPETKAVRSKRDCVDLSERVSATFYDQEHEEWTQQTVTIADVLDSVCDEYTILPSAQPERKKGHWIEVDDHYNRISGRCSACGWESHLHEDDVVGMNFCPNCGADMRGEKHETD